MTPNYAAFPTKMFPVGAEPSPFGQNSLRNNFRFEMAMTPHNFSLQTPLSQTNQQNTPMKAEATGQDSQKAMVQIADSSTQNDGTFGGKRDSVNPTPTTMKEAQQ